MDLSHLLMALALVNIVTGLSLKCGEDIVLKGGEKKKLKFWSSDDNALRVDVLPNSNKEKSESEIINSKIEKQETEIQVQLKNEKENSLYYSPTLPSTKNKGSDISVTTKLETDNDESYEQTESTTSYNYNNYRDKDDSTIPPDISDVDITSTESWIDNEVNEILPSKDQKEEYNIDGYTKPDTKMTEPPLTTLGSSDKPLSELTPTNKPALISSNKDNKDVVTDTAETLENYIIQANNNYTLDKPNRYNQILLENTSNGHIYSPYASVERKGEITNDDGSDNELISPDPINRRIILTPSPQNHQIVNQKDDSKLHEIPINMSIVDNSDKVSEEILETTTNIFPYWKRVKDTTNYLEDIENSTEDLKATQIESLESNTITYYFDEPITDVNLNHDDLKIENLGITMKEHNNTDVIYNPEETSIDQIDRTSTRPSEDTTNSNALLRFDGVDFNVETVNLYELLNDHLEIESHRFDNDFTTISPSSSISTIQTQRSSSINGKTSEKDDTSTGGKYGGFINGTAIAAQEMQSFQIMENLEDTVTDNPYTFPITDEAFKDIIVTEGANTEFGEYVTESFNQLEKESQTGIISEFNKESVTELFEENTDSEDYLDSSTQDYYNSEDGMRTETTVIMRVHSETGTEAYQPENELDIRLYDKLQNEPNNETDITDRNAHDDQTEVYNLDVGIVNAMTESNPVNITTEIIKDNEQLETDIQLKTNSINQINNFPTEDSLYNIFTTIHDTLTVNSNPDDKKDLFDIENKENEKENNIKDLNHKTLANQTDKAPLNEINIPDFTTTRLNSILARIELELENGLFTTSIPEYDTNEEEESSTMLGPLASKVDLGVNKKHQDPDDKKSHTTSIEFSKISDNVSKINDQEISIENGEKVTTSSSSTTILSGISDTTTSATPHIESNKNRLPEYLQLVPFKDMAAVSNIGILDSFSGPKSDDNKKDELPDYLKFNSAPPGFPNSNPYSQGVPLISRPFLVKLNRKTDQNPNVNLMFHEQKVKDEKKDSIPSQDSNIYNIQLTTQSRIKPISTMETIQDIQNLWVTDQSSGITSHNQQLVSELQNWPDLSDFLENVDDSFGTASLYKESENSSTDNKHKTNNVVIMPLKRNFTRGPEDTVDMKILNSIMQTIRKVPLVNKTEIPEVTEIATEQTLPSSSADTTAAPMYATEPSLSSPVNQPTLLSTSTEKAVPQTTTEEILQTTPTYLKANNFNEHNIEYEINRNKSNVYSDNVFATSTETISSDYNNLVENITKVESESISTNNNLNDVNDSAYLNEILNSLIQTIQNAPSSNEPKTSVDTNIVTDPTIPINSTTSNISYDNEYDNVFEVSENTRPSLDSDTVLNTLADNLIIATESTIFNGTKDIIEIASSIRRVDDGNDIYYINEVTDNPHIFNDDRNENQNTFLLNLENEISDTHSTNEYYPTLTSITHELSEDDVNTINSIINTLSRNNLLNEASTTEKDNSYKPNINSDNVFSTSTETLISNYNNLLENRTRVESESISTNNELNEGNNIAYLNEILSRIIQIIQNAPKSNGSKTSDDINIVTDPTLKRNTTTSIPFNDNEYDNESEVPENTRPSLNSVNVLKASDDNLLIANKSTILNGNKDKIELTSSNRRVDEDNDIYYMNEVTDNPHNLINEKHENQNSLLLYPENEISDIYSTNTNFPTLTSTTHELSEDDVNNINRIINSFSRNNIINQANKTKNISTNAEVSFTTTTATHSSNIKDVATTENILATEDSSSLLETSSAFVYNTGNPEIVSVPFAVLGDQLMDTTTHNYIIKEADKTLDIKNDADFSSTTTVTLLSSYEHEESNEEVLPTTNDSLLPETSSVFVSNNGNPETTSVQFTGLRNQLIDTPADNFAINRDENTSNTDNEQVLSFTTSSPAISSVMTTEETTNKIVVTKNSSLLPETSSVFISNNGNPGVVSVPFTVLKDQETLNSYLNSQKFPGMPSIIIKEQGSKVAINSPKVNQDEGKFKSQETTNKTTVLAFAVPWKPEDLKSTVTQPILYQKETQSNNNIQPVENITSGVKSVVDNNFGYHSVQTYEDEIVEISDMNANIPFVVYSENFDYDNYDYNDHHYEDPYVNTVQYEYEKDLNDYNDNPNIYSDGFLNTDYGTADIYEQDDYSNMISAKESNKPNEAHYVLNDTTLIEKRIIEVESKSEDPSLSPNILGHRYINSNTDINYIVNKDEADSQPTVEEEFTGESPFFIRLPGTPNEVPIIGVQIEPVEINYVPIDQMKNKTKVIYDGFTTKGSELDYAENTENFTITNTSEKIANKNNTDAGNVTDNSVIYEDLEITTIITDTITVTTKTTVTRTDDSESQEVSTETPNDTLFYRILDNVAQAVGNTLSAGLKSKQDKENQEDKFQPNRILVDTADPFFVMEPPKLGKPETANKVTFKGPSSTPYPIEENSLVYSADVASKFNFQIPPEPEDYPLQLSSDLGYEGVRPGSVEDVPLVKVDEFLYPGYGYGGNVYNGFNYESLSNPVFDLANKPTLRPPNEVNLYPQYTPFPITANPPRKSRTTTEVTPKDKTPTPSSTSIKTPTSESVSYKSTTLESVSDKTTTDYVDSTTRTITSKYSNIDSQVTTPKILPSIEYPIIPSSFFDDSYEARVPSYLQKNDAPVAGAQAFASSPLNVHQLLSSSLIREQPENTKTNDTVLKSSISNELFEKDEDKDQPESDHEARVYSAYYSPHDIALSDLDQLSYRKIPGPLEPAAYTYNEVPLPAAHTSADVQSHQGQLIMDPPEFFGPEFFKYLNSLPYPLLRSFLNPKTEKSSDTRLHPLVRRSVAENNGQVFCEWNIKTDPGLFLLMTFHNLSASYTLDCHGAYIEVERENNGYDARWCGNRVLQASGSTRPHVIFAKTEVRITVYDDGTKDKDQPTGFEGDVEVIDLRNRKDYDRFMRSDAHPHIRRLLNG